MKMMKVTEYAKEFDVSVQSVYQRIKSGSLVVEIQDGIKYVKVDDKDLEYKKDKQDRSDCQEVIKVYKAMVKDLKKQIKDLKKDKDKNYQRLEVLFDRTLNNLGFAPLLPNTTNVIDVKPKKKKKKKRKK